jgi:acetyltransferase-like isoleucine patch superfamily enzyme
MCAKKSDSSSHRERKKTVPSGYFKHPLALVESEEVGEGTRVWAWSHIMTGAKVGRDCNIGEHCFLESGCSVGDRVIVKNGVCVWELVTVEDDVFLGPNMIFTNATDLRAGFRRPLVPTLVRKGASIGAGAVIVCGNTLGKYCSVGAGAVVTKDIPDYALVYGNPARQHGWVCRCGIKLDFADRKAQCSCGRKYIFDGRKIHPLGEDE